MQALQLVRVPISYLGQRYQLKGLSAKAGGVSSDRLRVVHAAGDSTE